MNIHVCHDENDDPASKFLRILSKVEQTWKNYGETNGSIMAALNLAALIHRNTGKKLHCYLLFPPTGISAVDNVVENRNVLFIYLCILT